MTKNPEVRFAKSIVDYIFRWMATKFLSPEAQYRAGVNMREEPADPDDATPAVSSVSPKLGTSEGGRTETVRTEPSLKTDAKPRTSEFAAMRNQEDAPPCSTCGSIMIRSGSCYKCANCGTTSGCA
jgi:ribonucleoside-diphosphate reductase alpha chain